MIHRGATQKAGLMDHLPPLFESNDTSRLMPLLCSVDDYDSKEFASFPKRRGWAVSRDQDENFILTRDGVHSQDLPAKLALVQAWLFFGLLQETFFACGVEVLLENFVGRGPDGTRVVSTACLPAYIDKLHACNIWTGQSGQRACERILSCFRTGSEFIQEENTISGRLGEDSTSVDSLILSIQILGETLEHALKAIWTTEGLAKYLPEQKIWSMKSVVPGRTGMRTTGGVWCKSEKIMLSGLFDTTTLYYASILYRPNIGLDHSKCGSNHCIARQIDNSVYRTKHVNEGCQCKHVPVDTEVMGPILERGHIPCVDIVEVEGHTALCVVDSEERDYVAMSHVWSDGLGNAQNNSLPLCQLRRLSAYITALTNNSTKRPLLWIDTLCVPLIRIIRRDRDLALALLGHVYEKASIVLVLDRGILRVPARNTSIDEKLLRVCLSGWMRRLWTLKEGVLGGSRTRFQFLDDAIELPSAFNSYYNTVGCNAMAFIQRYLPTHIQSQAQRLANTTLDAKGRPNAAIMNFLIALQYRTTSRLTDETLCTASLLGEDIDTLVLLITPAAKMVGFISLLRKSNVAMPLHILFCGGEKLQIDNFRWAPKSFLQMGTVDGQWLLDSFGKGAAARISEYGLVCRCAGFIFDINGAWGDCLGIRLHNEAWCKVMPRTDKDTAEVTEEWKEIGLQLRLYGHMAVVLSPEFDLFGVLVAIHCDDTLGRTSFSKVNARVLCKVYVFWDNTGEEDHANIVFFDGKRTPNDQLWCIG
ncbi:hypothetical protein BDZ45DRAFT_780519 [Acephala macrosclerotiorum]|nr:hypothetical protein BDZ45DRAFT_780519 [Acephala macrosclerotiorum]